MGKEKRSIDIYREQIGQYHNKQVKEKRERPPIPSVMIDSQKRMETPLVKKPSEKLTSQQKIAQGKKKKSQAHTQRSAHVNILPSVALTTLMLLTLFPQPVGAKKESKQKSATGDRTLATRDKIPEVSLTALEQKSLAQNVFFPTSQIKAVQTETKGIGFDGGGDLLALNKEKGIKTYTHTKGRDSAEQPVILTAKMARINLTKTECITEEGSLNATCATVGRFSLLAAYSGHNPASAATNGDSTLFNIGPVIPDDNVCLDTEQPLYPRGTEPSEGLAIVNANLIFNQNLYSTQTTPYFAPYNTLDNGLEAVSAEHVDILGENEDRLVLKGIVVDQADGKKVSTLYVNKGESAAIIDQHPLCVFQNAGEIRQSKLNVVIGEYGQVERRDLILARSAEQNSHYGEVVIIRDIDNRDGQNIDLNGDLAAQNVQVLSGFNWGDASTRSDNLIDVIVQERIEFDSESSGFSDEDSTGLENVKASNLLMVSSFGQSNGSNPQSYLRPRVFIINPEDNTRIGIQDESDVSNVSDLGYALITAGALSQELPNGEWLYSNYPVITRPSTGEMFILSPEKVATFMAQNKGQIVLVDISQLSELVIDDPDYRCNDFGKRLYASSEEDKALLGMDCGQKENTTSIEVLNFQQVIDAPHSETVQSTAAGSTSVRNAATKQSTAEDSSNPLLVDCREPWSIGTIAAVASLIIMGLVFGGAYASCRFFGRKKEAGGDVESPTHVQQTEQTPLVPK